MVAGGISMGLGGYVVPARASLQMSGPRPHSLGASRIMRCRRRGRASLARYLAGRTEVEHYQAERKREQWEVDNCLRHELDEIVEIFEPYGLNREALRPMLNVLANNKETFVDFMMRFELNLELPSKHRALQSAGTIGLSYILGGLVPLFPYFFVDDARTAMWISVGLTLLALFIFGVVKARFTGHPRVILSAMQTTVVGAIAAGAAFGIAKLVIYWQS